MAWHAPQNGPQPSVEQNALSATVPAVWDWLIRQGCRGYLYKPGCVLRSADKSRHKQFGAVGTAPANEAVLDGVPW